MSRTNIIDVVFFNHLSKKNYIRIKPYGAYHTTHPSERTRGGIAILIKNILHFQQEEIGKPRIRTTIIGIQCNGIELYISIVYCPRRHNNTQS